MRGRHQFLGTSAPSCGSLMQSWAGPPAFASANLLATSGVAAPSSCVGVGKSVHALVQAPITDVLPPSPKPAPPVPMIDTVPPLPVAPPPPCVVDEVAELAEHAKVTRGTSARIVRLMVFTDFEDTEAPRPGNRARLGVRLTIQHESRGISQLCRRSRHNNRPFN